MLSLDAGQSVLVLMVVWGFRWPYVLCTIYCGAWAGSRSSSGHATDGPRADLIVASAHSDADVVASAKDYVDEVEAMFERVSTVNVAEMTATIEQGLSNLEAVIALIPLAVEPPGRA